MENNSVKHHTELFPNSKKVVGHNFLHTHSKTEKELGLDEYHVIVDKEDLMVVWDILNDNPHLLANYNFLKRAISKK